MEFSGLEMKVGYDASGGLMKDHIFGGKAFREVQNPGLGDVKIGSGFDPSGQAESVPSQDVKR
jgi:hypothetical protein